ncbi:MAG: Rne/Rng family ribonuclease [Alphaproteobacteria bacterium]|nr:Rne/Rng family ribonuclease [Alphaproteobacteria bacterium]
MAKRMLIDAAHPEETRVVVLSGNRLEEFDFESSTKKQVKGNIYLAKVTRVEPSLQAAFVDYGGNRHGFLAFSEIHPDYYRIPVSDRSAGEDGHHEAPNGMAANGGDEAGVPILAALPEPVPVPESARGAEGESEEDLGSESLSEERGSDLDRDKPATLDRDKPATQSETREHEPVSGASVTDWEAPLSPAAASGEPPEGRQPEPPEASSEPQPEPGPWHEDVPSFQPNDELARHRQSETGFYREPDPAAQHDRPPAPGLAPEQWSQEWSSETAEAGDQQDADTAAAWHHDGDYNRGFERGSESMALRAAEQSLVTAEITDATVGSNGGGAGSIETFGGDEVEEVEEADAERRRRYPARHYKIQEVIKRRQIMLVQVAKEERGNKGAALTTYLSLAGRYCVLMPNTGRGGGVSRKITSLSDRRRLKEILEELEIPEGMGVIVRTAGAERSKAEIKRDYEYLLRLWNEIRDLTLKSTAPALIYEEGNLIKRSIRDLYTRDIDEVLVEGEEGYKTAKAFMRTLMPSHAKRVQPYRDPQIGLFHRFQVESQIDAIHSPVAQLRSGGYVVINQTEALVSIDVNSGRSTRERNIEETALRTNLEAAEEIARQLRLRDLAGLIVIDFIDMEEHRNQIAVERRLKEALKNDRARIQVGRISPFGLLEMSRQRLRPSLTEASTQPCPHCGGTGFIRSVESAALYVLRSIEEEGIRHRSAEVCIYVPTTVALYILNQKRESLAQIEARYGVKVAVARDDSLIPPNFRLERLRLYGANEPPPVPRSIQAPAIEEDDEETEDDEVEAAPSRAATREHPADQDGEEERGRRRRRRRRRRSEDSRDGRGAPQKVAAEAGEPADAADAPAPEPREASEDGRESEADRRRRRRGRRGGRVRGRREEGGQPPSPPVAAEMIEIVQPAESERDPGEAAVADLEPWAGDAGLEAASLAPLAGDEAGPSAHPRGAEQPPEPAVTAEAEEGVPFISEPERVLEEAAASAAPSASPAARETPAADAPASPNEDILTVTEKPANPRRGWWQRLVQP